MKLKITSIGNSAGVILPREVLERLKVGKGDALFLHETKEGYELSPYDPEMERQMELARVVMREHRDVLKKLAE